MGTNAALPVTGSCCPLQEHRGTTGRARGVVVAWERHFCRIHSQFGTLCQHAGLTPWHEGVPHGQGMADPPPQLGSLLAYQEGPSRPSPLASPWPHPGHLVRLCLANPWPPCRPGVPGMPGCPEHSPGILLSSICKDLLMSPRRKRRKSCFILSWRGWKGAEKDHSSGDRSEEGWQCLAGSARVSAGDIPLFSSLYNLGCSPQRGPSAVCTCHSIPVARVPSQHPAAPGTAQDVCGVWSRARGCASGFVYGWGLFGVGTAPS